MANLDTVIDALFAKALDSDAQVKEDLVATVITERRSKVQDYKASTVLSIYDKMQELEANAPRSVTAALEECLKALVKA